MAFMEPDIEFGEWYEIDGPNGTEFIPADVAGEVNLDNFERGNVVPDALKMFCENSTAYTIEKREGWGARLSAPGYMDCTEWSVFETEQEAKAHLEDMYGDDDDTEEETDETDV